MIKNILFLLLISLTIACAPKVIVVDHIDGENIRMDEKYPAEDSDILALIQPYKEQLDAEMNEVIGITEVTLKKSYPQSTMGNWFADMLMAESILMDHRVSFAMQNRGGLRINSISKGEITKGKVFELMPFDNALVIMETDGVVMKSFIEHTIEDGGWPMSKEIQVTMQDTVIAEILIQSNPIDESATYYYAVPDYVANGGSDSAMLKEQKRTNTGIMIRDIVINHMRKQRMANETITSVIDSRITKK